jgi:hypothetical protein
MEEGDAARIGPIPEPKAQNNSEALLRRGVTL